MREKNNVKKNTKEKKVPKIYKKNDTLASKVNFHWRVIVISVLALVVFMLGVNSLFYAQISEEKVDSTLAGENTVVETIDREGLERALTFFQQERNSLPE